MEQLSKEDLELKAEKERIRDEDRRRDAMRHMAWWSVGGMILYPLWILLASFTGLAAAATAISAMAPTYFVSVAAIVAAFFGKEALEKHNVSKIK